jgi:hypothetical protein
MLFCRPLCLLDRLVFAEYELFIPLQVGLFPMTRSLSHVSTITRH